MDHYTGGGRHPDLVKFRQGKLEKSSEVVDSILGKGSAQKAFTRLVNDFDLEATYEQRKDALKEVVSSSDGNTTAKELYKLTVKSLEK